ncbi:hypothetical protein DFJ74DRAFT_759374 [Hyaloraphidium curvatum]|nr:hypothetical protein DFJ74DRAFT_759374 [Hyaloraphidium curvatum]
MCPAAQDARPAPGVPPGVPHAQFPRDSGRTAGPPGAHPGNAPPDPPQLPPPGPAPPPAPRPAHRKRAPAAPHPNCSLYLKADRPRLLYQASSGELLDLDCDLDAAAAGGFDPGFRRRWAYYRGAECAAGEYKGTRWTFETQFNAQLFALIRLNPPLEQLSRAEHQRIVNAYRACANMTSKRTQRRASAAAAAAARGDEPAADDASTCGSPAPTLVNVFSSTLRSTSSGFSSATLDAPPPHASRDPRAPFRALSDPLGFSALPSAEIRPARSDDGIGDPPWLLAGEIEWVPGAMAFRWVPPGERRARGEKGGGD